MRILLVRHGETEYNASSLLQGSKDIPLSERGRAQAESLRERLVNENLDLVLSSNLSRAAETAEIILRTRNIVPHFDQQLRERSYGEFEGRTYQQLQEAVEKSGVSRNDFRPKGGENYLDLEHRLTGVWNKYLEQFEGTALISAHGAINKAFMMLLLGPSFTELPAVSQGNTCVNILEGKVRGSFKATLINCTSHLSPVELS